MRFIKLFFLLCVCLILNSCKVIHPTHQTSYQQTQSILNQSIKEDQARESRHRRLPSNLNNSLLPPLSHYVNSNKNTADHFDVSANNMPAKEFFMSLVAGTKYNMIVHPSINGTISLNLKNVSVKQAMDAVQDIYGYQYHQTSYGFEVLPPQLETQLFHINYLDIQRTGHSYIQLTTGQVSSVGTINVGGSNGSSYNPTPMPSPTPGSTTGGGPAAPGTISSIDTRSEMEFWKTIQKSIQSMVTSDSDHNVTINAQAGVIVVRAYPRELHNVARYINNLQSSLNRQVILEAKILEVELDDTYQAGIDWSVLGNPAQIDPATLLPSTTAGIGQAANVAFTDTDLKSLTGIFAIRINGNFKTLINLLETQGNVQILSSPHISTVNNQKAVIKVGQDEFFVTGVSTTNTIIGTNTLPSQDVSLTPFFSGITLDVTPEISSDDTVILHIHPSVSLVKEQIKTIGLGSTAPGTNNTLVLPLAKSTIRESDNIVRAKNGQVIVIGGLMQNNMTETIASTPWLGNVPFLGALFRRTAQKSVKSELVILLRPIVASNQNQIKRMETDKQNFQVLKRPFHAGGQPEIFGNEGK
jgi:MSHA biogenesis protein MshL